MDQVLVLNTPEQLQALAHPTRHRILNVLVERTATNKQLAAILGDPPARIHFHVRELLSAGLVAIVEERTKGGVVEKYYRAVARSFRLGDAFQYGNAAGGKESGEDVSRSLLISAKQELQAARRRSSYAGVRPIISAHLQGTLSPEAVDRVKLYLALITQEFDRVRLEVDEKPFALTLVMHPRS